MNRPGEATDTKQRTDSSAPNNDDERFLVFGQIAEDVKQCVREGHEPDVELYASLYPQWADQIRELVGTLGVVNSLVIAPVSESGNGSRETESDAVIPQQLGDYRIIGEIGRGGMGIVYEAEQVSLQRHVALKVLPFAAILDPRQIKRFKSESLAAAQLHHTNIVPIFSVGNERGIHYYAMQYIEGQTLARLILELQQETNPQPVQKLSYTSASKLTEDLLSGRFVKLKSREASTEESIHADPDSIEKESNDSHQTTAAMQETNIPEGASTKKQASRQPTFGRWRGSALRQPRVCSTLTITESSTAISSRRICYSMRWGTSGSQTSGWRDCRTIAA
jgi:hypothetical protein